MTCETIKSLLSEFADERLDAGTAWAIQTHLAECGDCAKISRDMQALRQMLGALPTRQPSAQFDASLAQRLALVRRPERRVTWQDRLVQRFHQAFSAPKPILRPALALGMATAAFGLFLYMPQPGPAPVSPQPVLTHATDRSLVAVCVQQHRSDAAAEPLSDLAAQNLDGQLEATAASNPLAPNADEAPL